MVLIKGWSLLLEAAMLALWPKPQQMCCFCFSLANWQPSVSSLRMARERKMLDHPPSLLIKSTIRPSSSRQQGKEGRKEGMSSFCGEKPCNDFMGVCTRARNAHADSGRLSPAAIRNSSHVWLAV